MNDDPSTSPAQAARADEIFFAAMEIEDPAERIDCIQKESAGDEALQQEVMRLFGMEQQADQMFQESVHTRITATDIVNTLPDIPEFFGQLKTILPDDDEVGKQIGNYKLLQKIGEGGVGNVYLAEQTKPVRRQVAFKIIKAGMDTKSVIARFEAERQALAMMAHPNIARVLNAGETETGRPFFVMDLVQGERITTYCNENKLPARRRLELFIDVCNAIQHAHQKGIIHRDIKPSNVLIALRNGKPSPVVIDFGIAKATGEDLLTEKTVNTAMGSMIGTPAYMSPEQTNLSQTDIDTRSDIYGLGALLYELLVNRPPFEHKELLKAGLDEMCRILRETDPPHPSVRLMRMPPDKRSQTAAQRGIEAHRLETMLSGDLDWIVMKALEKDRTRRYETADAMAVDVEHFLTNEPVTARPPSRRYRFQKLVRRNKLTFVYLTAFSIAVLAGLGTSTWLFLRERETRRSEQKLRAEADARAKIAQAALLLRRGQTADAERMMQKITIPVVEPSLEAAGVFRTLGEWNVMRGRWEAAANNYMKLQQANQLDKSNTTEEMTRDLLGAGPALIVAGKTNEYRRFVNETLIRFSGTTDPSAAEQVIKNSLILPQDDVTLQQLAPFVQVVTAAVEADEPNADAASYLLGWRTLAIALYEYRTGHPEQAVSWAQRSLNYPDDNPPYVAMDHLVSAMAHAELGHADRARKELTNGRNMIKNRRTGADEPILNLVNSDSGVWHDWVIGHLLLQQAEPLVNAEALSAP